MTEYMPGRLTLEQVDRLLQMPHPDVIERIQGNDYIPQQEVRAELTRIFGHGRWDSQVVEMVLIFEQETETAAKKPAWHVAYRAGVRLRVRDYAGMPVAEFIEYHIGDNLQPSRAEAHATACTAAESYALRRAAIGLGDKYGLGLYSKDSSQPLVKGTLMHEQMKKDSLAQLAPVTE